MMIPFSPISNGTKPHGRPFGQAWAKRNETAPMLALEDARTALVDLVEFCIPTTGTKVPSGPGWLHEIKQDGFRLRVERDGNPSGRRVHREAWLREQFENARPSFKVVKKLT
jgi:hypothetical protein